MNIDPEANYSKQKQIIGAFNERMEKNNLSHNSYIKSNPNNKDQISNMFKNLSDPNDLKQDNSPVSNNSINIPNKSVTLENNLSKDFKQYSMLDFDKKNEEDFISYKNVNNCFNEDSKVFQWLQQKYFRL